MALNLPGGDTDTDRDDKKDDMELELGSLIEKAAGDVHPEDVEPCATFPDNLKLDFPANPSVTIVGGKPTWICQGTTWPITERCGLPWKKTAKAKAVKLMGCFASWNVALSYLAEFQARTKIDVSFWTKNIYRYLGVSSLPMAPQLNNLFARGGNDLSDMKYYNRVTKDPDFEWTTKGAVSLGADSKPTKPKKEAAGEKDSEGKLQLYKLAPEEEKLKAFANVGKAIEILAASEPHTLCVREKGVYFIRAGTLGVGSAQAKAASRLLKNPVDPFKQTSESPVLYLLAEKAKLAKEKAEKKSPSPAGGKRKTPEKKEKKADAKPKKEKKPKAEPKPKKEKKEKKEASPPKKRKVEKEAEAKPKKARTSSDSERSASRSNKKLSPAVKVADKAAIKKAIGDNKKKLSAPTKPAKSAKSN